MKPNRAFGSTDNIYDLVDAVVDHGFAVILDTKTPAEALIIRLMKALKPYKIDGYETFYKNERECAYVVLDRKKYPGGNLTWQPLADAIM